MGGAVPLAPARGPASGAGPSVPARRCRAPVEPVRRRGPERKSARSQDIAWKLALAAHGHGRPGLLESFEIERLAADHQVLEVSGRLDGLAALDAFLDSYLDSYLVPVSI
jgi:hypothetical protein